MLLQPRRRKQLGQLGWRIRIESTDMLCHLLQITVLLFSESWVGTHEIMLPAVVNYRNSAGLLRPCPYPAGSRSWAAPQQAAPPWQFSRALSAWRSTSGTPFPAR